MASPIIPLKLLFLNPGVSLCPHLPMCSPSNVPSVGKISLEEPQILRRYGGGWPSLFWTGPLEGSRMGVCYPLLFPCIPCSSLNLVPWSSLPLFPTSGKEPETHCCEKTSEHCLQWPIFQS
jgi:hypothetical protein